MAGKKTKKTKAASKATQSGLADHLIVRLRESAFVILAPLAIYLLVALASYDPVDPGIDFTGDGGPIRNAGGVVGAWLASLGFFLFGYLAFLFPLMLAWWGWLILAGAKRESSGRAEFLIRLGGFVLTLAAGAGLAHLHMNQGQMLPAGSGGILGQFLGQGASTVVGHLGSTLLMLALFLSGITLFSGVSWLGLMDKIGAGALAAWAWFLARPEAIDNWRAGKQAKRERQEVRVAETRKRETQAPRKIEPVIEKVEPSVRARAEVQMPLFKGIPTGDLPPLTLLDEAPEQSIGYSKETLEALARQVELKLADFKIEVQVVEVLPGPVVTRFELEPAPGVKGAQIANLAKDIARGLSVISVRIVDVIPGKSVIGLEIPNTNREIVYLSEILRSKTYDEAKSPLTLGLGKDISGKAVIANIAKMPHLLVAGTTGSGKSVAVNAMVVSILYKASAEDVRLIMIDPKMLELSVYDGIPHLLAPVVTDMKDAANALRWCVAEMERRYQLMAALGVRNLAGFNRKVKDAIKNKNPIKDPLFDLGGAAPGEEVPDVEPLPFIVVVVDEFADMMMIVGKKVEELIARLAQKARASGIHLILATQRPSVDVITGLIKANIPTRMAFQVSSKIDSRTILDQGGAEQLLGHGDMLYLPPGTAMTERVHGAFIDDHEVHAVVEYLKSHGEPTYIDEVLNDTQVTADGMTIGETGLPEAPKETGDELYDKAVYIVTKSRRASISSVQRQLRIGYNRAARIIEEMEAAGIVTPPEHNGTREVLAPPPPED